MIKILCFLWNGHTHKWTVINEENIDYKFDYKSGSALRYTLQCEHCGNIKTKLAI